MTDHALPPWDQTLEAVVTQDGMVIARITESDFSSDVDDAHLRRIVAAVNATRYFSTEGLEQIAVKGLTMELALQASLLFENAVAGERVDADVMAGRLRQLLEVVRNTNEKTGTGD